MVIFGIYNSSDSNLWKASVSVLALVVKVIGNKGQLKLVEIAGVPPWIGDAMLFSYEYSTALLCRILQLSIPDQTTAMFMSVGGAIIEMGVRVFFFNLFLKAGMATNGRRDKKAKEAYFLRGRMRVQDGSNDMVVEYVSSVAAAAILVFLVPTGAFQFSLEVVDSSQILTITLFQIVPEIFLDYYCTFTEVFGGLANLHVAYWSLRSGGKVRDIWRILAI